MIYTLDGVTPTIAADAWIAPGATVIGDVHVGARASVWFGAVLRGDVERLTLGEDTNVQDNAVLHSDPGSPLVLGSRVTVGHLAMLHGCSIGEESLIGIGAVVMNDARIGPRCIVGAGALVTEGKAFAEGTLILGSPAKAARALTAGEIGRLAGSAERYVRRAALYRQALRPA